MEAPNRCPQTNRKQGKSVLAKYSYKANPDSPLGKELTMKQGDKLVLVSDEKELWWVVRNSEQNEGYVPASYLMVLEPVTQLPWLQKPEEEAVPQKVESPFGRPAVKPYQSAYSRGPKKEEGNQKKWYCEVCDKALNGPQPYHAHMASRAHRETVEYEKSMGRL